MITYTYRCNNCDFEFEDKMTYSSYLIRVYTTCPECGSKNTTRKIESSAIIYKGEGFTKQTKEE